VNRKALDQFLSFNEQRQLLLARQQEMDKDNAAIKQLIHSLDQQKEEVTLSSTT
jgi:structural maintenance of chromosome 3 (chondroitin sulfate proteoglycan 6)